MSDFYISVKHKDGLHVKIKPGGSAERQIITDVKDHLMNEGVGWFKSEAKVLEAVEKAITETLLALKSDILP